MMMPDYLALAEGLDSRELIQANKNVLDLVRKHPNQDYYTSLYTYNDKHVEQFKRTKSLKGITDVKTSRLFFDFDSSADPSIAQKDTIEALNRLLEFGVSEENIRIYFSGNKGFHLDVFLKERLTRQEFVNIVFNVAGDLQTFDTTINAEQRILREPFSKHPKSKLYKIPIVSSELKKLSIAEIRELAKDINIFDLDNFTSPDPVSLTDSLNVLKEQTYKKINPVVLVDIKGFNTQDLDKERCPPWMSMDRFALSEGFFYGSGNANVGERNKVFMILAATYRHNGFDAKQAAALLEITSTKQAQRTNEEEYGIDRIYREIISSVYSPNFRGGVYSKDEPILVETRRRFNITESVETDKNLIKIEDVGTRFKQFAANFHENRILTGIKSLDEKIVLTTGMVVGLLGAPSSGKTSILNKIIKYQSQKNIPCIYQSLDMSYNLLYLRMLQQHLRLPIEAILKGFQQEEPPKDLLMAYDEVLKSYSNVHFNFRSAMTVERIDKDIEKYKEDTGLNPKFIAIDYLEKIRSDFSDPTASSGLITSQLSDLAKKHEVAIMILLQPQKSAGAPDQPLLSMRKVKGSSLIEQDLRCILTAWRPGFNPQDMSRDKYLSLAVVKNNLGELCQLDYAWNGLNGEIEELDYTGRKNLTSLLQDIEESKSQQDDF
jgi:KaiC/GvpD/RAD55 family RecA-like ATPase